MAARGLDCNEIVELVTDYLEGALDARTAAAFAEHLAICAGCRRYVEQIRRTIDTAGGIAGVQLSGEAETALVEAFRTFHRPA
jgi:anti-sigma factor RsiW